MFSHPKKDEAFVVDLLKTTFKKHFVVSLVNLPILESDTHIL